MSEASRFLGEAIAIAVQNVAEGGGPFGCVVVRDGEVIGRGANRVTESNDPTAHAEVVAIRDACAQLGSFQLDGCELYCSCEPCPMCLGAIYWARPAAVYFAATRHEAARNGFDDSYIYEEIARPVEVRAIPMRQLEKSGAAAPFEAWQAFPGRTRY